MNPFDMFVANALEGVIKEELGARSFNRVKKRIQQKYDMDMLKATGRFYELDATLREYFGKGADKIEKKAMQKLLGIGKKDGDVSISIFDSNISRMILETYGDPQKKKILEATFKQSNTIVELLEKCSLSKTSGYRWINEMIQNGLLTETSFTFSSDGKRVGKYLSLFRQIGIMIKDESVISDVVLNQNFAKTSNVYRVLAT